LPPDFFNLRELSSLTLYHNEPTGVPDAIGNHINQYAEEIPESRDHRPAKLCWVLALPLAEREHIDIHRESAPCRIFVLPD
jgi:hypothetical protein